MTNPAPLCVHLQPMLEAELAAGNEVKDRGPAPSGQGGRMVLLRHPFKITPAVTPVLRFQMVNDPHWWLAEFTCTEHHDMLACGFA